MGTLPNPRLLSNDALPWLEHFHERLDDDVLVMLGHLGGQLRVLLLVGELLDLATDGDEDLGLFAVPDDVLDVFLSLL